MTTTEGYYGSEGFRVEQEAALPIEEECVLCGEKDVIFVDGLVCRMCAEGRDGDG